MQSNLPILLASASPRRRQLLGALGVAVTARPSDVNEDPLAGEDPLQTQERVTLAKAAAAGDHALVIACDTTVLLDGAMLNKPADDAEAWAMLTALRGRVHTVNSCVVVSRDGQTRHVHDTTDVWMRDYRDDEIAAYIASGDPFDKAGAYAVQHAAFHPVARIQGCPLNIIGLPLCALRRMAPDEIPDPESVCSRVARELGVPCDGRACDVRPAGAA